MKISACLITNNEENHIAEAINSIDFADEIVVVDSESTDDTRKICRGLGAKVFVQKWLGFGKQKQLAVEKCAHDWIFSLDADERVSPELSDAIREIKASGKTSDGYRISRLTFYMGRPIKHSGWYPDWQLRFFNRQKGNWKDLEIHESVEMSAGAEVTKLKKNILHYTVESPEHHHRMIGERYAPLAAKKMFENGRRTSKFRVKSAGVIAFIERYFLKLGFLDGFEGYCIAKFAAHHDFLKHLILFEMQNKKTPGKRQS